MGTVAARGVVGGGGDDFCECPPHELNQSEHELCIKIKQKMEDDAKQEQMHEKMEDNVKHDLRCGPEGRVAIYKNHVVKFVAADYVFDSEIAVYAGKTQVGPTVSKKEITEGIIKYTMERLPEQADPKEKDYAKKLMILVNKCIKAHLIHFDPTPSNIMKDKDGNYRFIDWDKTYWLKKGGPSAHKLWDWCLYYKNYSHRDVQEKSLTGKGVKNLSKAELTDLLEDHETNAMKLVSYSQSPHSHRQYVKLGDEIILAVDEETVDKPPREPRPEARVKKIRELNKLNELNARALQELNVS